MPAARIGTFDDWVDLFRVWRNDIGVNYPEIENYQFEAKFGPTRSNEIEFGAFKGRPKWRRVLEIPDQRIRDGLMNLIVYQGDTEFASVEQQRRLFMYSPSEHDRQSLTGFWKRDVLGEKVPMQCLDEQEAQGGHILRDRGWS